MVKFATFLRSKMCEKVYLAFVLSSFLMLMLADLALSFGALSSGLQVCLHCAVFYKLTEYTEVIEVCGFGVV